MIAGSQLSYRYPQGPTRDFPDWDVAQGVSLGAAALPAWGAYPVSVLELLQTR